jgi:hypothetical protein
MSTILFIIAAWLWFVLVMQDGKPNGTLRIVLWLPIVLPIGATLWCIREAANKLTELLLRTSDFIMNIGKKNRP